MKRFLSVKKRFSLIIVCMLVISLAGCSKQKSEDLNEESLVYNYEQIPCMNEIKGYISDYQILNDSIYLYTTNWDDDVMTQRFYKCLSDGTKLEEIPFESEYNEDEWLTYMDVSVQGELYLLYSYCTNDISTYILRIVGADGNIISEFDITEFVAANEIYILDMKIDNNGNVYLLTEHMVYVFGKSGDLVGQVEDDNLMLNMTKTDYGTMLIGFDFEKGYTIKEIDPEEFTFCETYNTHLGYNKIMSLTDGFKHSFYYNDGESLYGYDLESGVSEEIISWMGSNININYIGKVKPLSDGKFVMVYGENVNGDTNGLYILTQIDPQKVKEKEIITYCSLYQDEEARIKAIQFNESQDQYQVIVKDYSREDDPVSAMHKDMIAGNAMDIVELSGLVSDKYIAKGLLEDLYIYMEDDPDIAKDDFIKNVLQIMETEGKLYHITPSFDLNVMAADADIPKGPLTIQDIIEYEKKAPKGAKAFYMFSWQDILSQNIEANYNSYVDWQKGVCYFDSQEFISLLEYASTYPPFDEIEWTEEMETMNQKIGNGTALYIPVYCMGVGDIFLYEKMYAGNVVFRGFPSQEYSGGALSMNRDLAIYSASDQKEGAWAFLKTFLTREYASAHIREELISFPVRQDSMEDIFRRYTTAQEYIDDFGNEIQPLDSVTTYDDVQVQIVPLNKKQEELMYTSIASMDHVYVYDTDIISIVQQEAESYFDGERSAQETAQMIQDRVSLYMSDFLAE